MVILKPWLTKKGETGSVLAEKLPELLDFSKDLGSLESSTKVLKEFLCFAEGEVRSLASLYSVVGRNVDALIFDPLLWRRSSSLSIRAREFEKKKSEKEAATESKKMNASDKGSEINVVR
ncbi:hypothetical protein AgCh_027342 [Apium graveolens]